MLPVQAEQAGLQEVQFPELSNVNAGQAHIPLTSSYPLAVLQAQAVIAAPVALQVMHAALQSVQTFTLCNGYYMFKTLLHHANTIT